MGLRIAMGSIAFFAILPVFALAAEADPYSIPQPTVVENKLFEPSRELNLQVGILPLDAFYKAAVVNFGYTHYFQSYWGWEVLNATAAFNQETSLRKDLRSEFAVEEAEFLDFARLALTTNIVYTPVYNKNLLFNRSVVHGEISGVFGGGIVSFESEDVAPMVGGGLIFRFFSSERWSYKLDNRVYYHLADGKSTNFFLTVNLGIAFEMDPSGKQERRKQ